MPRLSLEAIAAAVSGEVVLGSRPPDGGAGQSVTGFSIDSRSARPGDLFFALVGPRHDGHAFVNDAVERGAAAAVVGRGSGTFSGAAALVRVGDTTTALQQLGAHVRRHMKLKVVGITGSAGKTTAKDLTAAVAAERYLTFKTEGNLNNTYGLPLSLLRMPDDREVAILEMGMSTKGEIARLAQIADPDIGVILNVLRVHLEHFGSIDRIAEAKGELFRGMRGDALAVVNVDDPRVARLGRAFKGKTLSFGIRSSRAEVRAGEIVQEGVSGTRFELRRGAEHESVHLRLPGRHNVYNALAAAAVGYALGLDTWAIRRALEAASPAAMRGALHRLPGGLELLDDSYNSNPTAMEKAIDLLRDAAPRGRRILVSGDMLELGPYEKRAHEHLGEQVAAAGLDLFVAVGPLSTAAAETARATPPGSRPVEVIHFADAGEAAPWVAGALRDGDLVLVKGSRGMRMETVVRAVLERAGRPAGTAGDH